MPFTPYHTGPSGLAGLLLRRWVDVPVFVAANVLIDIEVMADRFIAPGWPVHQVWHFHTLLIGGLAGAIFGAIIYWIRPLRWTSEKSMALIGLPGKATWQSMMLGGLLGAWVHVLTDSFYHYDVQLFWPYKRNPVYGWMMGRFQHNLPQVHHAVETACLVTLGLAVVYWTILILQRRRNTKSEISNKS